MLSVAVVIGASGLTFRLDLPFFARILQTKAETLHFRLHVHDQADLGVLHIVSCPFLNEAVLPYLCYVT